MKIQRELTLDFFFYRGVFFAFRGVFFYFLGVFFQLEVKDKLYQETVIKLTMDKREKIHAKVLIKAENLNKSFGGKIIFKHTNF